MRENIKFSNDNFHETDMNLIVKKNIDIEDDIIDLNKNRIGIATTMIDCQDEDINYFNFSLVLTLLLAFH